VIACRFGSRWWKNYKGWSPRFDFSVAKIVFVNFCGARTAEYDAIDALTVAKF